MTSTTNKNIYLKLNNYDYSKKHLTDVKEYIQFHRLPSDLTPQQHKKFIDRYKSNLFNVKDNKLYYTPLHIELIEDDPKIINAKLKELYDDMKIGTGMGIRSFYNKVIDHYLGIKRETVRQFIIQQEPYQLRKLPSKPINKPIIGEYPNQRWALDLIDLSYIEGYNGHKKYIMTVIDFFSKYVFAVALNNKMPSSIIAAFNTIGANQSQNTYPNYLQCDNGGEFKNAQFKKYCEDKNIKLIFTKSYTPTTNGLVENFNKYLRKMIFEGFVRTNSKNWADHLNDYIYNRNHTKHSVTKQKPVSIWQPTNEKIDENKRVIPLNIAPQNTDAIQKDVLNKLKTKAKKLLDRYEDVKLVVGDKVRIATSSIDSEVRKHIKAGESKKIIFLFTEEIYTIRKVINPDNEFEKPSYLLSPHYPNRRFYANELQKVNLDDHNE